MMLGEERKHQAADVAGAANNENAHGQGYLSPCRQGDVTVYQKRSPGVSATVLFFPALAFLWPGE
jgi:hypothetical protein